MEFLPGFPPSFPPDFFVRRATKLPKRVTAILIHNLESEHNAVKDYIYGADKARAEGDLKTAAMLDHIKSEEQHHVSELLKRLEELRLE